VATHVAWDRGRTYLRTPFRTSGGLRSGHKGDTGIVGAPVRRGAGHEGRAPESGGASEAVVGSGQCKSRWIRSSDAALGRAADWLGAKFERFVSNRSSHGSP
jgi:hypothetical protein